jgi:hypothetical protein
MRQAGEPSWRKRPREGTWAEDVVGDVEEDVVGEVAKPRKVDGDEAGVKLELVVPDKVQEDRTNFNLNQMLKKIRPIIKNN